MKTWRWRREKPNAERTTIKIDSLSLSEGARKNTCWTEEYKSETVTMGRCQDDG